MVRPRSKVGRAPRPKPLDHALLWDPRVWRGAGSAAIEFGGWICPLTPLEKWLRELGGEGAYAGGFIAHYLIALIYPEGLTRNIQLLIGAGVLAINAAIYLRLWQRHRARR